MFPSSRRAEAPQSATLPPGHPPLCLSIVTPHASAALRSKSIWSARGEEATEHNTRSGHNKVFLKTREKLQAASSSAARLPEGRVSQHHAGKSSGGLSP